MRQRAVFALVHIHKGSEETGVQGETRCKRFLSFCALYLADGGEVAIITGKITPYNKRNTDL